MALKRITKVNGKNGQEYILIIVTKLRKKCRVCFEHKQQFYWFI